MPRFTARRARVHQGARPRPWPGALVGFCLVWLTTLVMPAAAAAQEAGEAVPPSVTRAPEGVTVRAVRITRPIQMDGRLDEEIYQAVPPIDGFIQQEPAEGDPATEATHAWIFFDDRNVYVSARCLDSHPEREVLTELRRDQNNITQNESFTVVFDTFHDRRNGLFFQTNALGAIRDQAVVDDALNINWNTVWNVRTQRTDDGWTLEMVIPFKSLRYGTSGPQTWGVNFRRVVKWKNEYSYLTAVPRAFGTGQAIARLSVEATLVGLETPSQSRNLEVKPYAVSSLTTDRRASVPFENRGKMNGGFDFKYGLTRGLIADMTVNTDFAQVEEDVQQVNLTRFNLFFPEKRDFFLEGAGIFAFGGVTAGSGTPGDVPVMFFSRRIGLSNGQDVPVIGGGRLTGRSGAYSIGAVNIQTDEKPAAGAVSTNFTAFRLKRDFLRRSNLGVIATRRAPSGQIGNTLFGADTNLFLFQNVTANAYYTRSETAGIETGNSSYRGRFEYAGDRYGMTVDHLLVGANFDPQVGYVRRNDFRLTTTELRFSPRPRKRDVVRKYTFQGTLDYFTDAEATVVQNREWRGFFQTEFQNSDNVSLDYTRSYELLPRNFTISPGVVVPQGGYAYQNLRGSYNLGQQRKLSGRLAVGRGTFYDGTRTEFSYSGRMGVVKEFAFEPSISFNWVDLPFGTFSTKLVNSRFIYTPSARMMISSLVQFNASTRTLTSSVRMRWEYQPGSDVFVVYADGRDTSVGGFPEIINRSLAVKLTRLFRF